MLRQGLFSRTVHGLLDYVFGGLLIASPFLFAFDSDAATAVAIVLGLMLVINAAMSDMPTGLSRTLAASWHMLIDVAVAALLIASPFLFGFTDDGTATPVFIVAGVLWLLVVIGSRLERARGDGDVRRGRAARRAAR
jgi:hypothetical protein